MTFNHLGKVLVQNDGGGCRLNCLYKAREEQKVGVMETALDQGDVAVIFPGLL